MKVTEEYPCTQPSLEQVCRMETSKVDNTCYEPVMEEQKYTCFERHTRQQCEKVPIPQKKGGYHHKRL